MLPGAARHPAAGGRLAGAGRRDHPGRAEQELLAAERHAALRDAFAQLTPCCQQLLAIHVADPPVPYAEITNHRRIHRLAQAGVLCRLGATGGRWQRTTP